MTIRSFMIFLLIFIAVVTLAVFLYSFSYKLALGQPTNGLGNLLGSPTGRNYPDLTNLSESPTIETPVTREMLVVHAQNKSEILNDTRTSNLTELGLEDFPTTEDMNEINSIKRLGSQATNEVKTFTGLIDEVAGTCAYKMDEDVFNTTLAQMCADLMVDYADTLRNFTESNRDITNAILYN